MIKFPKTKISKGCEITFYSKDTQERYAFFHYYITIEEAKSKSLQFMINLGNNPSEYKMSTRHAINISITF